MILNIYKEKGWTSFDVVAKVRGILHSKKGKKVKVGHAGTLDPLAEGVLLVLTEEDTKKQQEFMELNKEYVCEISFGVTSPTYDLESELTYQKVPQVDIEEELTTLLPNYQGEIMQRVPPYSAVKVKGKALYRQARAGEIKQEDLPIKKVTIHNIKKLDFFRKEGLPTVKLKVLCSKGTYMRSLAHDSGQDLGVGGVLSSLVRTRIGDYKIEDSIKIANLEKELGMLKSVGFPV